MNDMIAFELGMMGSQRGAMKKNKFRLGKENKNDDKIDEIPQNQGTLDLLRKNSSKFNWSIHRTNACLTTSLYSKNC